MQTFWCTILRVGMETGSHLLLNLKLVKKMTTSVFRVVSQGDVTYVASQKAESGQLAKCLIRLKEFGGGKFGVRKSRSV